MESVDATRFGWTVVEVVVTQSIMNTETTINVVDIKVYDPLECSVILVVQKKDMQFL